MIRMLLAAVWLLSVGVPAFAGRAQLNVDVDRFAVGQTGRLVLSVVDDRPHPDAVKAVEVPDGLVLTYRGNKSNFRSNGAKISQVYSFEYSLSAMEEGAFTIGPFEVPTTGGGTLTTNLLDVEVLARPEVDGGPDLQVKADFETGEVYEGQVVLYRYELTARVPVVGVQWHLPEFDGLRQPQHGDPWSTNYRIDDIDGRIYVDRGAVPLIAVAQGERKQGGALAEVRVPVGRQNVFGFSQHQVQHLPTPETTLRVKPLPEAPDGFSGLIGNFEVRSTLDKSTVGVGESVEWTVHLSGDGAVEGFTLPSLPDTDGLRVYESEVALRGRTDESSYMSMLTVRRVLVPTAEGKLELPNLQVVAFSPTEHRYVTHEIRLGTLDVRPGTGAGVADVESFSTEPDLEALPPEAVLGPSLRELYTWGFSRTIQLGAALPLLLGLVGAPGALVLLLEGRDRVAKARARRAAVEAARPPTTAEVLAQLPTDPAARLAGLDGALRLAIAQHIGVEVVHLDRPAAIAGLGEPLSGRLSELVQALDRARFAGQPAGRDLEEEVRQAIRALEAS